MYLNLGRSEILQKRSCFIFYFFQSISEKIFFGVEKSWSTVSSIGDTLRVIAAVLQLR